MNLNKNHKKSTQKIRYWLLTLVKSRLLNLPRIREKSLDYLQKTFNANSVEYYKELQESDFFSWFSDRERELEKIVGYSKGTMKRFDRKTLYLLVRASKPDIVVDTGVLYGASSSHILEALHKNGKGKLFSVDLPNDPKEVGLQSIPSQDFFVRDVVKDRWELTVGDSEEILPELCKRLQKIDLFFHDSCHSYEFMLWEYNTVYPYFNRNYVLSSHDALTLPFSKNAFTGFCKGKKSRYRIFRDIGISVTSKIPELNR